MNVVTLVIKAEQGNIIKDQIEIKSTVPPTAAIVGPIITAYEALSGGVVQSWSSSEEVTIGSPATPVAGCSRENWATLQCVKADMGMYSFDLPEPKAAVRKDYVTLDIANAALVAFAGAFVGGKWRVSHGEQLAAAPHIKKGRMGRRSAKHSHFNKSGN
jgi:hypothetical protein